MSVLSFIIKSILRNGKDYAGVLLSVVISAAALSGALFTGDSIDATLKQHASLSLQGAGYIIRPLSGLLSAEAGRKMGEESGIKSAAILSSKARALHIMKAAAAYGVNVYGVADDFFELNGTRLSVGAGEILLNTRSARELNAKVGDRISLALSSRAGGIDTAHRIFSAEKGTKKLTLKCAGILKDEQGGRFSLKRNHVLANNAFVNIKTLNEAMGLSGRADIILVKSDEQNAGAQRLREIYKGAISFEETGLSLTKMKSAYNLHTDALFLNKSFATNVLDGIEKSSPQISYFLNEIRSKDARVVYSGASSVPENSGIELESGEVALERSAAKRLNAAPGDSITIRAYEYSENGERLKENKMSLRVKEIYKLKGTAFEKLLAPRIHGFNEAKSCSQWRLSDYVDTTKISAYEEDFWNRHAAAPKVYLSLSDMKLLTSTNYSSIQINSEKEPALIKGELGKHLPFDELFFVEKAGLSKAVTPTVDFASLFVSLSFFIILASVLLCVIVFRLFLKRREGNIAMLYSFGFSSFRIKMIYFIQTLFIALAGAAVGTGIGAFYKELIIQLLTSVWSGAIGSSDIVSSVSAESVLLSVAVVTLVSLIPAALIIRDINTQGSVFSKKVRRLKTKLRVYKLTIIAASLLMLLCIIAGAHSALIGEYSIMRFSVLGSLVWLAMSSIYFGYMKLKSAEKLQSMSPSSAGFISSARNAGSSFVVYLALSSALFIIFSVSLNSKDASTKGYEYKYLARLTSPAQRSFENEKNKTQELIKEVGLNARKVIMFSEYEGDDASCLNLRQAEQPSMLACDIERLLKSKDFTIASYAAGVNSTNLIEVMKEGMNGMPAVLADKSSLQWNLYKEPGDIISYVNGQGKGTNFFIAAALKPGVFQGKLLLSDETFKEHFPRSYKQIDSILISAGELSEETRSSLKRVLKKYSAQVFTQAEILNEFNRVENSYLKIFMLLGAVAVLIGGAAYSALLYINVNSKKGAFELLRAKGFTFNKSLKLIFFESAAPASVAFIVSILSSAIAVFPALRTAAINDELSGVFTALILLLILTANSLLWILLISRSFLRGLYVKS